MKASEGISTIAEYFPIISKSLIEQPLALGESRTFTDFTPHVRITNSGREHPAVPGKPWHEWEILQEVTA